MAKLIDVEIHSIYKTIKEFRPNQPTLCYMTVTKLMNDRFITGGSD